ncbi:glutaminase A [Saccharococcus caldoxylosilyticus]|uniref:Glutaminase n=2 Tax=Saccharococcus caldoxylosilyticus TaxID=81408 RepID=A0A023DJ18_9BACL|nr:glutaminase A [Parageobacillus caldoxylosilyticus]KYD10693.1 Glutaminase [Parageobacillus caldoxylosilyticus]MBB3854261.1 glutaminase [Parageobacillus caldoxylosilyticus]BDG36446.1 glutaminase [Parageobacillus caldoxylosilyticus]BDG40234.1 glutaminase [Parageobacillus caldoxylosilyticus]GAJ41290.1 glutaminase [Parageobacillus caldoxylosilyticus NBRC 107762]
MYTKSELEQFVKQAKQYARYGKVADYIPALGKANPNDLSIAIYMPDGNVIDAGDTTHKVTLQSISKIIALALVLMDRGEQEVFRKVGMEPTGDPFNSIAKLEEVQPAKPLNPMINAGALAVTHMIAGASVTERFERLLQFVRKLAGNPTITYSEEVAQSEFETAFLNRSLCYFLKQHGIINEDVEELMDLYTKQCAIEMTCDDLARIGLVFAMDGRDPFTGEQIMPLDVARICKTFMVTCGMYNASGEFAIKIGIPAKSGVSGGILAAVPGRCGIGIFGPALDEKGNSITGMKLLELLSKTYSLSIF